MSKTQSVRTSKNGVTCFFRVVPARTENTSHRFVFWSPTGWGSEGPLGLPPYRLVVAGSHACQRKQRSCLLYRRDYSSRTARPLPAPTPARVVDLGAAPGGWSLVAARIVHGRGARGSRQQRGGRPHRGGAPPQLPPPLPEARVEAAERRGRRGGAVVAVDLLELETDLPGVEV